MSTNYSINIPPFTLKFCPVMYDDWSVDKKYTIKGEEKRKELEKLGVPEEKIVKKIGLSKKGRKSKFYNEIDF